MRFLLVAAPLLAVAWWYAGRPRRPVFLLTAALMIGGPGLFKAVWAALWKSP